MTPEPRPGAPAIPMAAGRTRRAAGRYCLLPAALALLAACAPVQPWERGTLAKPHMALQPFPLQAAFREHIYGSRESASGGAASTGGGGCGCY